MYSLHTMLDIVAIHFCLVFVQVLWKCLISTRLHHDVAQEQNQTEIFIGIAQFI